MSSLVSTTRPFRTRTARPPSPSMRARAFTEMVLTLAMELALPAERFRARVERPERPLEVGRPEAELRETRREGGRIRRLHRPEARVAAPVEGRANGPTAPLR